MAALAAALIIPAIALGAPKTKAKPTAPTAPKAPTVNKPKTKGPAVKKPTTKPKVKPTKKKKKKRLQRRPPKKKPPGNGGGDAPPQDPPSGPAPQTETGTLAGFTAAHNTERALVGTPPLKWSTTVAGVAQQWAEDLAANNGCSLAHNPDRGSYGENLFWTTTPRSAEYVVAQWAAEKANYDADTHTCAQGQLCKHYTQVVWNNTTEVGCGMTTCENGHQLWVCNYNPTGNYVGQQAF